MIQTIQTLICRLFPVIGAVCVLFPGPVTAVLPYLLGGAMALAAAARGVSCRRGRGLPGGSSDGLAHALILLIMGTAFIAQGANALGPMGTTWAIFGIRKASRSLGRAIRQLRGKGRFMAPLLEFLLRITLALMLLFDPFEKFSSHVVILGLELMATSVRFSKNFLPAWEDWGA
ncbi:hypothetical protein [Dysosmobacter sp.]|uniref:hypothetical protein n=1 Tax=Dysosmobacter sp. TaxID=2591382 RepID=UPI002A8C1C9D|nr:hypothetical protein [Dysosmobacter sp.]MDY3282502.1 hypothetical protein [Dysosmobacter sp.]